MTKTTIETILIFSKGDHHVKFCSRNDATSMRLVKEQMEEGWMLTQVYERQAGAGPADDTEVLVSKGLRG